MQTVVNSAPAIASPGDIGDFRTATDGDIVTGINAEASSSLVLGTVVKRGTVERSALRTAAAADKATMLGIVVRGQHYSDTELAQITIGDATGLDAYTPDTPAPIGRTGVYAVLITEDVDIGDAVRIRCVAGATEIAGSFQVAADSTDCLLLPTDAFWWVKGGVVDAVTGVGVALLRCDFNHIVRAVADT